MSKRGRVRKRPDPVYSWPEPDTVAEDMLAELRRERDALLEAVRHLEFADAMRCPVCHASVDLGHYTDCPVHRALYHRTPPRQQRAQPQPRGQPMSETRKARLDAIREAAEAGVAKPHDTLHLLDEIERLESDVNQWRATWKQAQRRTA